MAEKISVADALDLIERHLSPSEPQMANVSAEACGLITAQSVRAAFDTPRFDCSAMDGFAVCSASTAAATERHPARFALAGDIPAGASPPSLPEGRAAPISTGAPIPAGADAVVARERCALADGQLLLFEPVEAGRNIRRRGEDAPSGSEIACEGTTVAPDLIGALLAYGVTGLAVRRPPSLHIFATGTEYGPLSLPDPSARLDGNGPMIGAMCHGLGLDYQVASPIPDDVGQIARHIDHTPSAGLIVSTGGVSVGAHDLVRSAIEGLGATILFHGVAMRPGKPILFAILPDGRPFFGLPGNPIAAMVGFRIFVLAAIRRLVGLPRETGIAIAPPAAARPGTTLFLRGKRVRPGSAPALLSDQRSHVMHSLVGADCWIRIEEGADGMPSALLFEKFPTLD